jgi:hypothetical protein
MSKPRAGDAGQLSEQFRYLERGEAFFHGALRLDLQVCHGTKATTRFPPRYQLQDGYRREARRRVVRLGELDGNPL